MAEPTNIPTGFYIPTQSSLNPKIEFNTLVDLIDFTDNKPYTYYNNMVVFCSEDNNYYKWREKVGTEIGANPSDFTYSSTSFTEAFDYSSKIFNFYKIPFAKSIRQSLELNIIKIPSNTNGNILEAGDYVENSIINNEYFIVLAKYVSGDPLEISSYNQDTVNGFDLNEV